MQEATGLKGEFRSWSKESRDEKVLALTRIINDFGPLATYHIVHLKSFDALISERFKAIGDNRDFISQPYIWCLFHMIIGLCKGLQHHQADPIEIICDEQMTLKQSIRNLYDPFRLGLKDTSIASILPEDVWFRDDKKFVVLQAADLVAGHLRLCIDGNQAHDRWNLSFPNVKVIDSEIWGGEKLLGLSNEMATMVDEVIKSQQ
jgi:hypothetical protein